MAKIISIPNDNDPVMNSERQRIPSWAATNGWIYVGYNDEKDHIVQLRKAGAGGTLDILDLDCHGAPNVFDHTFIASAFDWGKELARSTGFSGNTAIYLDACNTGLTSAFGGPIAQTVADGAGCTVFGTQGYMTGTYAEGNEQCFASANGLPPYPGAQNASGRNVWVNFQPRTSLTESTMNHLRTINLTQNQAEAAELKAEINSILQGQTVDFPNLRIAPDITFNYAVGNRVLVLDIYANGGLIKNRTTGETWRVDNYARLQDLIRDHIS